VEVVHADVGQGCEGSLGHEGGKDGSASGGGQTTTAALVGQWAVLSLNL